MNKSLITNSLALLLTAAGHILAEPIVFAIGLFALSGAVTNWIAVHMLFEKVPFLYGSGVIPAHFEEFKQGINNLMMEQFFTEENIDRFLSSQQSPSQALVLAPVIEKVDLEPAFNNLVDVIEQSSFGGMLAMVGGREALMPLKQPFIDKMKTSMVEISESPAFNELVKDTVESPAVVGNIRDKVSDIIVQRLNELTPQLVKEIVQDMIKKHLGWLVVWGGVFGGLIGFIAALTNTF
ncbi:DUF445 domain-containing protein [Endozoicomonas sp. G2_1]|uniref:DUF445 domain-containing protein n=1 Tax=Endozoicomonas sp. G2_1 TaxID=2821091 RepID=UPI001ADCC2CD|nr:DUF445 domain-containing protein [Endozoicomonas sp. G2_1]